LPESCVEKCAAYLIPTRNRSRARPPDASGRIKSEIVLSLLTRKSRSLLDFGLDPSWRSIVALGLLAVMMALISLASVPGRIGWFGVGLAELMLAIAVVDWRHFIIPDRLNAAAFALGLVLAWWQDPQDPFVALATALARGAVLAAAFWALRFCYQRVRGREGLGLGDVKLAGVAGVWLGWPMLPLVVELAAVAALIFYGLRQVIQKQSWSATSRLPFGVFLAVDLWITWLFENASTPLLCCP
jgi:leader peptidase (prepilin peptidase) / N-methyltransferase